MKAISSSIIFSMAARGSHNLHLEAGGTAQAVHFCVHHVLIHPVKL